MASIILTCRHFISGDHLYHFYNKLENWQKVNKFLRMTGKGENFLRKTGKEKYAGNRKLAFPASVRPRPPFFGFPQIILSFSGFPPLFLGLLHLSAIYLTPPLYRLTYVICILRNQSERPNITYMPVSSKL